MQFIVIRDDILFSLNFTWVTLKQGQGTFECSFEDSNPCTNTFEVVEPFSSNAAQIRWVRGRGSTGISNTGPNVDHTTGNSESCCLIVTQINLTMAKLNIYSSDLKLQLIILNFFSALGFYYYLQTSSGFVGNRALLKTIYRYPGENTLMLSNVPNSVRLQESVNTNKQC